MLICTQISTGTVLEMQSAATPGTLIANQVVAGYDASDLQEQTITPAQWQAMNPPPTPKPDPLVDLITTLINNGTLDPTTLPASIKTMPAIAAITAKVAVPAAA